jgi:hypothetical protein
MIFTILIWIYIFFLTTVIGHLLFNFCNYFIKSDIKPDPSPAELSMLGLVGTGTFLSYFSIFYKTGLIANVFLISIVLIYLLFRNKEMLLYFKNQIQRASQFSTLTKFVLFLYFVLLLFAAQTHPTVADTGIYHAQAIQWITNFKTIPGLGNLHGRFAFNNQSFLLEALFSFSFIKPGFFHLVNSYLLLIISFSFILSFQRQIHSNLIRSLLYAGLLILLQVFYLVSASSPTPDIFSTAGIWFIMITYLEKVSLKENITIYWIILLITSFFLVTVKLSSLPVVLIIFLFLPGKDSAFLKKIFLIFSLGIIVLIPFFIRNYILSGYLIYPYPFINIFNPDWKIPLAYVSEMKSVITTHAQSGDWLIRPFSTWFPIWFSHLSTGFKILSVFILLSPILTITVTLLYSNIRNSFRSELRILIICFLAIIFWFFSAPNYRFIYGFLYIYLIITGMIFLHYFFYESRLLDIFKQYKEKFLKSYLPGAIVAMILLFPFVFFLNFNYSELKKSTIFPIEYPGTAYKSISINNVQVNIPDDNTYCWNSPVPCSIIQNHIGITDIELRGKELKNGFRVKN